MQTIAYYLLIHKQMKLEISKINDVNYNNVFQKNYQNKK